MADIEADVIIVGSGVSGALLAAKLSQAGVRVPILEAGARVDRAEATQRFWNSAIRVPECPYPPSPEADHRSATILLVPAERARQIQEHLPQGRRRHDLALAGHLPSLRSIFATGATANPTLTIAALSLRAVDQVKAALTH